MAVPIKGERSKDIGIKLDFQSTPREEDKDSNKFVSAPASMGSMEVVLPPPEYFQLNDEDSDDWPTSSDGDTSFASTNTSVSSAPLTLRFAKACQELLEHHEYLERELKNREETAPQLSETWESHGKEPCIQAVRSIPEHDQFPNKDLDDVKKAYQYLEERNQILERNFKNSVEGAHNLIERNELLEKELKDAKQANRDLDERYKDRKKFERELKAAKTEELKKLERDLKAAKTEASKSRDEIRKMQDQHGLEQRLQRDALKEEREKITQEHEKRYNELKKSKSVHAEGQKAIVQVAKWKQKYEEVKKEVMAVCKNHTLLEIERDAERDAAQRSSAKLETDLEYTKRARDHLIMKCGKLETSSKVLQEQNQKLRDDETKYKLCAHATRDIRARYMEQSVDAPQNLTRAQEDARRIFIEKGNAVAHHGDFELDRVLFQLGLLGDEHAQTFQHMYRSPENIHPRDADHCPKFIRGVNLECTIDSGRRVDVGAGRAHMNALVDLSYTTPTVDEFEQNPTVDEHLKQLQRMADKVTTAHKRRRQSGAGM